MAVYLVTGAAGFIGANYVHHLLGWEPDAQVVAVDYLGFAGNMDNLEPVTDRVTFERADIADPAAMETIYRRYRPDFVVNFAAESHNDRAILGPGAFMRSNALGAQVMAECSRIVGVTAHVHVSTIEVYGELAAGQQWFTERSPLNAKTPYSAAKAAGDQIVRAYMSTYPELNIRMTHCANNYGPYQLPEKLIPLAVTNLLRGRKIPVYGDGLQSRDWLHVADHCAAVHQVLHAELEPIPAAASTDPGLLPIFDISARREVTNLDIARHVASELSLDPGEWIEHIPDRPNHDRRYLIDPTKLETELGWRPEREFEPGIAETVAWYVEHRGWWEAIIAEKGELGFDWSQMGPAPAH
ncbi:GDP-mannose 4,6-dehydratase [Nocardia cyriacigeorgica]|uniref:dTDP-glucose 4,6-dehydratase n=1 Tax=Nocardia cyriacigeorgica TaxID=135487 RepID=UPI00189384D0|nr:GDP-mannose 4,6-dehydratase [Nocardia cyriacigeorgica]MBF6100508.1 GDP-mannose 4,6-dehydratase [Nocardia cyriacigeorgica]MBF6320342.1 GDP-mannose 4,6-dehydratase [Nocardia cyriacigeorgica]MBF6534172.1 GDP-mannose 4,6-dehydratase [Nocardia cyriacigeorgica]